MTERLKLGKGMREIPLREEDRKSIIRHCDYCGEDIVLEQPCDYKTFCSQECAANYVFEHSGDNGVSH